MRNPTRAEYSMSRIQLLLIRLSASLLALLLLFIFVRVVWFPDGYFALSGVGKLLLVLLAVNLVLGPGLSTLVYKPGKPGLRFDLVLLACVECAAIGWTLVAVLAVDPWAQRAGGRP